MIFVSRIGINVISTVYFRYGSLADSKLTVTGEEKRAVLSPENWGRDRELLIIADAIVGILTHTQ